MNRIKQVSAIAVAIGLTLALLTVIATAYIAGLH